ncbi:MAG: hypothetical protein MUF49_01090 [Oculatellaceae cyanobacterium Prado106]|jgi:hypothetical protein|nr:hypothetical protein [Oculatellaceae cyanobacterium Prado106]
MPNLIENIHAQILWSLPPADQLRQVSLILNELVQNNPGIVDESDTWTEQDQSDLVNFSLRYATAGYLDDEELAE